MEQSPKGSYPSEKESEQRSIVVSHPTHQGLELKHLVQIGVPVDLAKLINRTNLHEKGLTMLGILPRQFRTILRASIDKVKKAEEAWNDISKALFWQGYELWKNVAPEEWKTHKKRKDKRNEKKNGKSQTKEKKRTREKEKTNMKHHDVLLTISLHTEMS